MVGGKKRYGNVNHLYQRRYFDVVDSFFFFPPIYQLDICSLVHTYVFI